MKLAPIGLTVYARVEHAKKTITALQNNIHANESHLYIFSDFPKEGDEHKVGLMRDYIKQIHGFKKITIVERFVNSRIKNNREGQQFLLDKYGKMIWLAEDIVTAPGFLTFMNEALDFYERDKNVLSICGYSPPIKIPKDYKKDCFALARFNAWGLGIWKDKYKKVVPIKIDDLSKHNKNKINENGEDIFDMMLLDATGQINAFDVRAMYQQYLSNSFTVYPNKSLVHNIGHDGSGIHCGKTNKFDVELWNKTHFKFSNNITPNKKIVKANFEFRERPVKEKITELTKKLGIYPFLKILTKKVIN